MKSPKAAGLVREIRFRLAELPRANTPAIRLIRRGISREISDQSPEVVMEAALLLLSVESDALCFFADELVCFHKPTFERLDIEGLLKLGAKMNSWVSVDCFGLLLAGPTWREGRIADVDVRAWAQSEDLWWRRAALVSTVALSRRGRDAVVRRVLGICGPLVADRQDMVVKALSWALRELSKKHPEDVRWFLEKHEEVLAARVIREVENKLRTGLKTPK